MAEQYVLDRMTILLTVAAIVILVAGATYVFTSGVQPPVQNVTEEIPRISVSGEATRTVSPDLLVIGIAVETENETASSSEAQNAEMTRRVKSALLAQGVREDEIETASYYTYPVYNDSCWYPPCYGDACPMAAEGEAAYAGEGVASVEIYPAPPYRKCDRQIIGYRTMHSIMVKTTNIYKGGNIIDAVSAANASARLDYQYFSLRDETRIRVENELAGEAAQSARSKAQSIAGGLGARLGRIVEIQTNQYYPPYYYAERGYVAEGAAPAEPVPTEIFPQDLTMSSYIYVTFEIEQD